MTPFTLHPTHPVPKHQRYSSKVPHPYLSSVFRRKGAQPESLSAQQTHSSVLNPSILWSQGFPPEIPVPDKPTTAQKGAEKLSPVPPCCSLPFEILANTVTKTPGGLCHKLTRIWGWSCHCCISHIRATSSPSSSVCASSPSVGLLCGVVTGS